MAVKMVTFSVELPNAFLAAGAFRAAGFPVQDDANTPLECMGR